jgi:hypothetical protein
MILNEQLFLRYITALESAAPELLLTLHSYRVTGGTGLSDVFLPTVPVNYVEAPVKVMVVGRETKGWRYFPKAAQIDSISDYVKAGMDKHSSFRDRERCLFSKSSRSGLIRLLKDVCKQTSHAGLIYSNLFAVDHNKKDPRSNKQVWPHIRSLSEQLLNIQIDGASA